MQKTVEPLEVNFDASNSSDSDSNINSYKWDFGDGSTSSKETVTHTYDSAANYTVELTVTNTEDTTDSTSQTIEVYPPPGDLPTASFTASPTNGRTPLEVSFDASGSSDPDGTIDSYKWDFDDIDNPTGSGVTVSHTFNGAGTYDVELTVTDNDGATDSISKSISVGSSPGEIDYRVGPKELIVEFEQDSAKAKEKYNGATVAVTGKIDELPNQPRENIIIFDGGGEGAFPCVYFEFPDRRIDQVKPLDWDDLGKEVTIVGEFDEYDGNVWFDNCYIE